MSEETDEYSLLSDASNRPPTPPPVQIPGAAHPSPDDARGHTGAHASNPMAIRRSHRRSRRPRAQAGRLAPPGMAIGHSGHHASHGGAPAEPAGEDEYSSYSFSSDLLVSPMRNGPSPAALMADAANRAAAVPLHVAIPSPAGSPSDITALGRPRLRRVGSGSSRSRSRSGSASGSGSGSGYGSASGSQSDVSYSISDSGAGSGDGEYGITFVLDGADAGDDGGTDARSDGAHMRSVTGRAATPHPAEGVLFGFEHEEARFPPRDDNGDGDGDEMLDALLNADVEANTFANSRPPALAAAGTPDGAAAGSAATDRRVLFGDEWSPRTPGGILRTPRSAAKHSSATCRFKQNVRIELPDGSYVRVNCLTSTSVGKVIDLVADQLGIVQREYLGLLEYSPHGYEAWLKPGSSLLRQVKFVVPTLKLKFKMHPAVLADVTDPLALAILFHQTRAAVVAGFFDDELDKSVAVEMTANAFQALFGDHNPDVHRPGFLTKPVTLAFFLSTRTLSKFRNRVWQKKIFAVHAYLVSISPADAMRAYLQLAATHLASFGMEYFHVNDSAGVTPVSICVAPDALVVFNSVATLGSYPYRDMYRVVLESSGRDSAKVYRVTFKIGPSHIAPDMPDTALAPVMVTTANVTDAELLVTLVQSYSQLYKLRSRARSRSSSRARSRSRASFSRVVSVDNIAGSLYGTVGAPPVSAHASRPGADDRPVRGLLYSSVGPGPEPARDEPTRTVASLYSSVDTHPRSGSRRRATSAVDTVRKSLSALNASTGSIPLSSPPGPGASGSGSGSGSDNAAPRVMRRQASTDSIRRGHRARTSTHHSHHRHHHHGHHRHHRHRGAPAAHGGGGSGGEAGGRRRRRHRSSIEIDAPAGRTLMARDSMQVITLETAVSSTLPNVRLSLEDGAAMRAVHATWASTTPVELYKQYREMLGMVDTMETYMVVRASSLGDGAKPGAPVSPYGGEWVWVEPSEPLLPQVLASERRCMVEVVVRARSFLGFNALELSDYESVHAAYLHTVAQLRAGSLDADLDEPILVRLAALQLQAEHGSGDDDVNVNVASLVSPALAISISAADVRLVYASLPPRPAIEAERTVLDIASTLSGFGGFDFEVVVAPQGKKRTLVVSPDGLAFAPVNNPSAAVTYALEALVSWAASESEPTVVEIELLRDDEHDLAEEAGGRRLVLTLGTVFEAADLVACLFAHDAY